MKKNIILIFAIALLMVSVAFAFSLPWKTGNVIAGELWEESDGGDNSGVAGAVYNGDMNADYCEGNTLYEQFINQKEVNGACISSDPKRGCQRYEIVNENFLDNRKVDCDLGCEKITIQFRGEELSAGQCKGSVTTETGCEDTDGGQNYYVKGRTTQSTVNKDYDITDSCNIGFDYSLKNDGASNPVDYCEGLNCSVIEGFCNDGSPENIGLTFSQCPNGCEDGACIKEVETETAEIVYLDPTDCRFLKIEGNGTVNCNSNEVVGRVTHVGCSNRDEIRVSSTAWYDNSLPYMLSYSCIDADTGGWKGDASYVFAYCCEIKGVEITTKSANERHTTTLNQDGTISTS